MKIYALHGFLGKPTDWEEFRFGAQLHAVDLFDSLCFDHTQSMNCCAQQFKPKHSEEKRILMGYSLGGRIALHLLLQQPQLWHGAIIISAHPGLDDPQEKQQRLMQDKHWASRFETEPWEPLIKDWNRQSVFKDHSMPRNESDYDRKVLSNVLKNWSLGTQNALQKDLEKLDLPILWIAGSQDSRYVDIARNLTLKYPLSRTWISSTSAHRVPWEDPLNFQDQVNQFLIEINR